jgi:hypothetical protein
MSQIQVDNIYNKEATGSPSFPLGANVTGVITATTFKGGAEITSGTISATSVTAASGTFNGPVTIGGTLTYEDVTNIDSVGVITARNGVKVSAGGVDVTAGGLDIAGGGINAVGVVTATNDIKANGNIIGDNSTNISGVSSVTATTYYGSGASLTGIDAAPSLKLNASGSIAAGKPTIVNTDGTVSEVKQTIAGIETPTYTGQNNIANPADYPVGVQIPGTDTMLMAYQYGSGANAGYARVMTRSATTLTQTSNEPSFDGSQVRNIGVVWDDNASRGVIFYVDWDDSQKFKARVCQVSGNTLSYGSITDFPGNETGEGGYLNHRAVYDPDTQKIIIGFPDGSSGSSWVGKAYVCTIDPSTNAISFGTVSTIYNSYNVRKIDLAYDTTNNKVVAMIAADTSGNDAWVASKVGTVSGTSITWGTEDDISTPQSNNASMVWMSDQQKLFCVYESDQSNKLFARIGTPSSSNVTWGTAVQCSSNNTTLIRASSTIYAAYDTYAKLPVVTWRATYSGDSVGFVAVRSISGTTPTFTNAVELSGGGGTRGPFPCSMNTSEGIPVMWRNTSGPSKYVFVSFALASTNVTGENFLGIAAASYTNGQEATIQISGNSNANQSGLTPGQNYFVQNNGTLGLTAASPKVYAGTAVSATKIAVGKESAAVPAIEILATADLGSDYGQNYFDYSGITNDSGYIRYAMMFSGVQFVDGSSQTFGFRFYRGSTGSLETGSYYNFTTKKSSIGSNSVNAENTSTNAFILLGTNNNSREFWSGKLEWANVFNPSTKNAPPFARCFVDQGGSSWHSVGWDACRFTTENTEWISGVRLMNYGSGSNLKNGRITVYGYRY